MSQNYTFSPKFLVHCLLGFWNDRPITTPTVQHNNNPRDVSSSVQKRNHLGLLLAIWLLSFSGIVPRYMAGGQYNQKWAAYFWARNSTTQYYIVCYRVSSKTKRALTMLILYERCLLYEKIWTLFLPPNTNRKMGIAFFRPT